MLRCIIKMEVKLSNEIELTYQESFYIQIDIQIAVRQDSWRSRIVPRFVEP